VASLPEELPILFVVTPVYGFTILKSTMPTPSFGMVRFELIEPIDVLNIDELHKAALSSVPQGESDMRKL
jgi:hypothetical protein